MGFLYMCTRLIFNLTQIYLPMYVSHTLNLAKVRDEAHRADQPVLNNRHITQTDIAIGCYTRQYFTGLVNNMLAY